MFWPSTLTPVRDNVISVAICSSPVIPSIFSKMSAASLFCDMDLDISASFLLSSLLRLSNSMSSIASPILRASFSSPRRFASSCICFSLFLRPSGVRKSILVRPPYIFLMDSVAFLSDILFLSSSYLLRISPTREYSSSSLRMASLIASLSLLSVRLIPYFDAKFFNSCIWFFTFL